MYQNGNQSKMHPLTFVNRRRRHCFSEKKLTIIFLQSKEILNYLFVYIFIKYSKRSRAKIESQIVVFCKTKNLVRKKKRMLCLRTFYKVKFMHKSHFVSLNFDFVKI
jgi:hypothetical protein